MTTRRRGGSKYHIDGINCVVRRLEAPKLLGHRAKGMVPPHNHSPELFLDKRKGRA